MDATPVNRRSPSASNVAGAPSSLAYPMNRKANVTLPAKAGRDPKVTITQLRIFFELASAGADSGWVLIPTRGTLARKTHISANAAGRAVAALIKAGYLDLRHINQHRRFVRVALSAYELDWE